MKEIKPSETARISGGATSTLDDPQVVGIDPAPVSHAQPLPVDLLPGPEPELPQPLPPAVM